ncbi:ral guanine nucleotide dissociation stimulator-like 1 isoform X2 [Thrips palmi]|uniref:Ral guanine nucleotide dissociation stimulator-like 1 isoform X2 n=1 Tax=Thrips palmi TaxID=161013 RepID=A0A6P8ZAT8_THRPL|nr:ral guanine nucleotide dissociation stimulator-like 1 isoform X2 [Thrips palmi]
MVIPADFQEGVVVVQDSPGTPGRFLAPTDEISYVLPSPKRRRRPSSAPPVPVSPAAEDDDEDVARTVRLAMRRPSDLGIIPISPPGTVGSSPGDGDADHSDGMDERFNNLRNELVEVLQRSIDSVKTPHGSLGTPTPLQTPQEKPPPAVPPPAAPPAMPPGEPEAVRRTLNVPEASPRDWTPSPMTPQAPRGLKSLLLQCACAPNLSLRRKSQPQQKPAATWYVKPTWRLWGEERAEGAIYTVYLKKVRYHRPTRTIASDADDGISHLEWETVRVRFVKAATLEKLVESLATDDGELESTYINVFLATYRTFATTETVLNLLLDRYDTLSSSADDQDDVILEQHRKTLVLALHVWLDSFPEDFRDPPQHPVLQQLLMFCKQHLPDSELHVKVRFRFDKFHRDDQIMDPCHLFAGDSMCLSNNKNTALVNGGLAPRLPYNFPDVPEAHFAEQLTRMDMELFRKLVPHQCLGAVWSRRDKSRSQEAATVLATVNQFNAVSFRVISTVLTDSDLKPGERGKIIATWIDIAQELRFLKNFSSLKAIISGLQSNPVYRLQRTWQTINKEKVAVYEELARIFSEENNQWAQRELLMREGTAKFADTVGEHDKQLQKVFQKQQNNSGNISHGTIPYLGTFLTDLTMIDTAIPDMVGEGMINFDKRRKEFEVLAQIKLLQGAANAYNIPHDPLFDRWFDSVLVLDDREAYHLSCQIEPSTNNGNAASSQGTASRDVRHKRKPGLGHRKNDSIASTSSSSSSQFYCDLDSVPSSPHDSLDRKASPSQMSSSSSSSSLRSLDVSVSSSNHSNNQTSRSHHPHPPHLNAQLNLSAPLDTPMDFYIIRVTVEPEGPETEGVIMYKSIMLSNNERTPQVIRNAMLKLGIEGNPDSYSLSQILPDKEMLLPPNANVYYAVNTQFNLNFILRNKKMKKEPAPVPPCRTKSSKKLLPGT